MAGKLLQHVIEEADAGGDIVGTAAVEVDAGFDPRLVGRAIDAGLPLHVAWPRLHGAMQAIISLQADFPPQTRSAIIAPLDLQGLDADMACGLP
jgi:hypothetical protein